MNFEEVADKQRVYAKIDLKAVRLNMDNMHKNLSDKTKMMAVVKTNGYGFGAVEISNMLEKLDYIWGYATATVEEAFELRENGIKICLATSKPQVFAVRILKYYDILQYFDYVGGADMDGIRVKKIDVLKWVTSQIEDFKYEDALMVGDRKYDKTGADGLGIKCVLIEYGFGSREELEKCEPFSIQSTVSDLQKFLDSLIKRG